MRNRAVALTWGVACHSLFLVAIGTSILNMYLGMHLGLVQLSRPEALLWDLCLLFQFPVLHSFLLSAPGSRLLSRLAPQNLGRDLASTTFVIIASVQMLFLYLLWAPLGSVWWSAHGWTRAVISVIYLFTWLLVGRSMMDAGISTQTGFLGWSSVFKGRRPTYDPMPTTGLFKYTRQPIYLAFALTTWTVPVWTVDQLLLALWFTSYCIFGPYFKEKRYRRRYGEKFESYRKQTPYFFPAKLLSPRARGS